MSRVTLSYAPPSSLTALLSPGVNWYHALSRLQAAGRWAVGTLIRNILLVSPSLPLSLPVSAEAEATNCCHSAVRSQSGLNNVLGLLRGGQPSPGQARQPTNNSVRQLKVSNTILQLNFTIGWSQSPPVLLLPLTPPVSLDFNTTTDCSHLHWLRS